MSKFKVGDRVVMKGECGGALIATLDRFIPEGEVFAGQWQATCDDGDPAVFHEHQLELIGARQPDEGASLTRRDHFAMAALTGLLANSGSYGVSIAFAVMAYDLADAMEAARNKEGAE